MTATPIVLSPANLAERGRPYRPIVPDSSVVRYNGEANHYRYGRRNANWAHQRVIFWHTSESPNASVQNSLSYDARRGDEVSAHYFVGNSPDGVGQEVEEADTAYTESRWNDLGISIEMCATAGWNEATWRAHGLMLDNLVELSTDICERNNIPAVWLTPQQLLAGASGICDHLTANQAAILEVPSRKGKTGYTHTDCGPGFNAVRPELIAKIHDSIHSSPPPLDPDPTPPVPPSGGTVNPADYDLVQFVFGDVFSDYQISGVYLVNGLELAGVWTVDGFDIAAAWKAALGKDVIFKNSLLARQLSCHAAHVPPATSQLAPNGKAFLTPAQLGFAIV